MTVPHLLGRLSRNRTKTLILCLSLILSISSATQIVLLRGRNPFALLNLTRDSCNQGSGASFGNERELEGDGEGFGRCDGAEWVYVTSAYEAKMGGLKLMVNN